VAGRKVECIDGCGLCCLCQPEVLPEEKAFFEKEYSDMLTKSRGPEEHPALALKKGRGSCVFLKEDNRCCSVYDHRTTYCKQFPYHIYVSYNAEIELDLSCRGAWTGEGNDAETEARKIVKNADARIRKAVPEASAVYDEFFSNCEEAGVMGDPASIRASVAEDVDLFTQPESLASILSVAEADPPADLRTALRSGKCDMRELKDVARDTALESMESDDPMSVPVYSAQDFSWNVFMADGNKLEWSVLDDRGDIRHKAFANVGDIEFRAPDEAGRQILCDYVEVLNNRDSFMGSVFSTMDWNGYSDHMANTYYGCLAMSVLDLMWRASMLDMFFGTGLGAEGMKEAIMFYDMDRLDAPAIGAFV